MSNNSNDDRPDQTDDVTDDRQHSDAPEAANEGQQAPPNSDRGGQPIAPQMGDPRAKDRRPN